MPEFLFQLPRDKSISLQARICEMLVTAILNGHLPPGSLVPSGRKLAQQLKVGRNTVVIAYEHLVDEGYLVARERSGFYVSTDILKGRVFNHSKDLSEQESQDHWSYHLIHDFNSQRQITKPADWLKFPYPFLYGQYDPGLFPVAEWRECCRDAASVRAIHSWASDRADRDDEELIEQIHTRMLPRRGVLAKKDEILITIGAQHALFLAAQLLIDKHKTVGMEEPGYTDARNVFNTYTSKVRSLPMDQHGLTVDSRMQECDIVHVTPSHQFPTGVTMPTERRKQLLNAAKEMNFIVIEDDYEAELNYSEEPIAALKSMDKDRRVIYIGSLSKTLAPGLRMGYLVGPKAFIDQARILRRLMLRHPPANNQFIVAQFLKRGYHDALIRRLHHTLRDRWAVMHETISEYFPNALANQAFGGSAFWLRLPQDIDTIHLERLARENGVLIEPGDVFFANPEQKESFIRLGFSSIPVDRIRTGLAILSGLIANLENNT